MIECEVLYMTIDVLIVEDDKDINELMKLSLTTKGIKTNKSGL